MKQRKEKGSNGKKYTSNFEQWRTNLNLYEHAKRRYRELNGGILCPVVHAELIQRFGV